MSFVDLPAVYTLLRSGKLYSIFEVNGKRDSRVAFKRVGEACFRTLLLIIGMNVIM